MANSRSIKSSAPRTNDVPAGYVADLSKGNMLRYEASLPHLPVPTLQSTGSKYLETVQPHLSDAAFKKTQAAVQELLESSQGKELQARLEKRASEPGMVNWLADWWNDVAYMGYRDPVVVNVSYFYIHGRHHGKDPAKRAAELVKATLAFREMVES